MWSVESDTDKLLLGLLRESSPSVPPRTQKVGAAEVSWWEGKPGDAVVMATGGSPSDRTLAEQIVVAQLESCGYKRAQFTFDSMTKEAGWPDIMTKAKRLIQSGNVTILRNGWNNIVGHVVGDHGEYNTEIGRDDPESRTISTWQCECPWDQYAWQRTRKWKKYEGRPCAHVMALYWKSLATPLDDYDPNQHGPMTPGQNQGPPSGRPLPGPGMPKGETPQQPEIPGMPSPGGPPTPSPVETKGPQELAPPSPSGALPTPPMDQLAQMQPPVPGATPSGMPANPSVVSVPGAKVPTPFNPIQFPGGTYSSAPEEPPNYRKGSDEERCGNCKMNNEGQCWGYGNKEIEADRACDSWYPEGKTSKVAAEEFVAPEIVRLKEDCYGMAEGKSEANGSGQYRLVPAGSSGEVLGQDPTTGWVEVIIPIDDAGPLEPYHVKCYVEASDLVHSQQRPPGPFIKRRSTDMEPYHEWMTGQCAAWAIAHQKMNPHLRFGLHWEEMSPYDSEKEAVENGEEWDGKPCYQAQHVFTHDDTHAYDANGAHPMPYHDWSESQFNLNRRDVEGTGMVEYGWIPEAEEWIRANGDPARR